MTTYLFAACISVIFVLISRWVIQTVTHPLRSIPGPFLAKFTNLWRLVNVLNGKADVVQRELHHKHGDIVRTGPKCVTISDPSVIGDVYSRRGSFIKSDFYSVNDFKLGSKILPTGFSTRSEKQHAEITAPINKFYTPSAILRYQARMNTVISTFMDQMSNFAITGQTCLLDEWLGFCAWDITGSVTFGIPFGFLATGSDVEDLIAQTVAANDYFAVVGQMPFLDRLLAKNPITSIGPKSNTFAAALAAKQLRARQDAKGDERFDEDFLAGYLKLQEADPSIPNTRIVQWLMRNIGAGSDTTAIALRALLYFVMRHPAVLARLQAELDSSGCSEMVRDGRVPEYERLKDLPYLDACVEESFRVHPAIALCLERRVPARGYKLPDGRVLPAGCIVGVNPAVVHRNQTVFGEDADDFRPERWLRGDGEEEKVFKDRLARMEAAMLTFGSGKRRCPGQHVAVIETKKITACLLGKFYAEIVDGQEWKTRNSWFHLQWHMPVKLRERED